MWFVATYITEPRENYFTAIACKQADINVLETWPKVVVSLLELFEALTHQNLARDIFSTGKTCCSTTVGGRARSRAFLAMCRD